MIGDNLAAYTFNYLLNQALATVPSTLDKRQGSIIYDAIAPACYVLAGFYNNLRQAYSDAFASTAIGEALDLKAAEQGITRDAATYAIRLGYFADAEEDPMAIPLGSRFSTVSDISPVKFIVIAAYEDPGYYLLRCETLGTVGNSYVGELLNISNIPGLASAQISTVITSARDVETDAELRERYFDAINKKAFGGNIADYDRVLKEIDGVGEVQIYPVWDGGGTVKCSIVDEEYNACSAEFIDIVQETVDPVDHSGEGLGTAPIGHVVTITTPTEITVNVAATVVLSAGKTIGQVQEAVETAIEDYFVSVRQNWGISDDYNNYSLGVFIARVIVAILTVADIANVTGVTLNGVASDITLQENSTLQQIPVLGTVTLSE